MKFISLMIFFSTIVHTGYKLKDKGFLAQCVGSALWKIIRRGQHRHSHQWLGQSGRCTASEADRLQSSHSSFSGLSVHIQHCRIFTNTTGQWSICSHSQAVWEIRCCCLSNSPTEYIVSRDSGIPKDDVDDFEK